ncbi:MAG: hypothetical protein LQ346_001009 [Caloplaca aetnensis]|nr:MAG: hypothetical protein LQ346_001009 [Caloplaca aetnensis]
MGGDSISDSASALEETLHRPLKRQKRAATISQQASTDNDLEAADEPGSPSSQSPSKNQENEDPDETKAKKPKYRIHEPKLHNMPEDAFFTQPPSRSPSPYRIDKFRWQKPKAPAQPKIFAIKDATRQQCVIAHAAGGLRSPIGNVPITVTKPTASTTSQPRPKLPDRSFIPHQDDVYDDFLADIPSDAFSSPASSPKSRLNESIEISSQGLNTHFGASESQRNGRVAAPLNNLRQTTLFGDQAEESATQSQTVRKRNWPLANKAEPATHHKLDREAMETWVYPTNLGKIRDYQYSIVAKGLYHNMLVALPTGLGKTFIAATIMLNWFRWTEDAQIVFVAPTKPLVSQQVKACFEIAGIPRSETTMLTGNTPPGVRAEEWSSKRVFFMTPQTIVNDLKSGHCDPKRLVLLVVDEAHRATGGYAYVEVVQFLRRFNSSFRVLALTATPGGSIESVQEVIDGLGISRIEIRTEESLDIREYVYSRKIETVLFDFNDEMVMIMDLFAKALQPLVDKLCGLNAYWGKDPMTLTPYGCTQARQRWMSSDAGRKAHWGLKGMVITIFSLLASLSHGIELLKFHGIGPFYRKALAFRDRPQESGSKGNKYWKEVHESDSFQKMMSRVQVWINNLDFVGHPKLEYLQRVVLNHFLDAGEGRGADAPSGTRIMVFAHYRDSAEEIARVLKRNGPIIRPRVFVGQATSKESEGMDQKTQLDVIQKFKNGTFNTLVATSIGEEGLDIGEVDLIVCYDASASPIRMLQRMGRTGRKRAGNIVVTLMRGKEESNFIKAKDGYERMQKEIAAGTRFNYHEEQSRRIVPRDIQPIVDKKIVEIPFENTQADLPEPSKRAKVPKRPPKKFHMPDGVRKGFVKASKLKGDDRSEESVEASRTRSLAQEESPEPLPPLSDLLLNAAEQREHERRYLDVKGDSPEIVETPRLDTFSKLQRETRPTKHVPHGRHSKRLVKMLRLMHDYAQGARQDFENQLQSDDRQEGLQQVDERVAFFTTRRQFLTCANSSESPSPRDSVARRRHSPLTLGRSSSVFEQPGNDELDKGPDTVELEMRNDRDPDSSRSPSFRSTRKTTFYQPLGPYPRDSSDCEQDLPDVSTLTAKPGTASVAALAKKTRSAALPSKARKRRKVVVEEDSDEE